jgi:cellobiose phosphorylase
MFSPHVSDLITSLEDHCHRAIEHGSRFGDHGLPLFGNGDWNDGMNLVGAQGRGESVWLAWFLIHVLDSFSAVASRPDEHWSARAAALRRAIEEHAWDGQWYLRGFFDDGSPLGSARNDEAKIDSLPQSWAVISSAGDPHRAAVAMDSAEAMLVRPKNSLVCLFTPPFDKSQPHPGYIMGYPPGMRENGGQYTHGSLWMALARARMGDGAAAVRLLQMMSPVECSSTRARAEQYRGEPYVVAADVSSSPQHAGTAGWTWYTGSAGWMYRIWLEEVLGFQVRGNKLYLKPAIPPDWDGFSIKYRFHSAVYEIAISRVSPGESLVVECDGQALHGPVTLFDDGKVHTVSVTSRALEEVQA